MGIKKKDKIAVTRWVRNFKGDIIISHLQGTPESTV
jgi:hypothetical protein